MIGGKKVEADHGIAVGEGVENSVLINGDVSLHFSLTQATAEAKTLQAQGEPRRLDWESTEARYDTWGVFRVGGRENEQATHVALIEWLQDDHAPPVFALLGEYGMGKTLECQRLHCLLRDASMSPDSPAWMPRSIYFDLRKSPQFRDAERRGTMALPGARAMVEQLIERDWVTSEGARPPGYDDIKAWLAQGALLIVDGLDECLVHLVDRQHGDFLAIWVDLVADAAKQTRRNGKKRPRLLVSCRTEFFRNLADQRALFRAFEHAGGERTGYREFELRPLSTDRIYGYIHARCPDLDEDEVRKLIKTTHNLGELAQRPITLKFVAEQLPKLLAMRQRLGAVNAASLYDLVIDDALAREDDRRHHLHAEHKRALLSALAGYLWRIGALTMSHAELRDWLHVWLRDLRKRDAKAEHDYRDMHSERLEEDLRTATLVVRIATQARKGNLERNKDEGFGFAHGSFYEYFLAVFLVEAVKADRPEDWGIRIPSSETFDFLAQKLKIEQLILSEKSGRHDELQSTLTTWLKTYRPRVSELILKYTLHAISRNVCSAVLPSLQKADFSGASLRGWRFGDRFNSKNLSPLDVSKVNWSKADLRECDFMNAKLDGGNFAGANLFRAAFQHSSLINCVWKDSYLFGTVFRHNNLQGEEILSEKNIRHLDIVDCPDNKNHSNKYNQIKDFESRNLYKAFFLSRWGQVLCLVSCCRKGILLAGTSSGLLLCLDVVSGVCFKALKGHKSSIYDVSVSQSGKYIASSSADGFVILWDFASGKAIKKINAHVNKAFKVVFGKKNEFLISASRSGEICAWGIPDGKRLFSLTENRGRLLDISATERGTIAVISSDGFFREWDLKNRSNTKEIDFEKRMMAASISGNGCFLGVIHVNASNSLYEIDKSKKIFEIKDSNTLNQVLFDNNSRRVCFTGKRGEMVLVNVDDGADKANIPGYSGIARSFAISDFENRAYSGGVDGIVNAIDIYSGERIFKIYGSDGNVAGVALSANGALAYSASTDGLLSCWDMASGNPILLPGKVKKIQSNLASNSEGSILSYVSNDGAIHLLEIFNGTLDGKIIVENSESYVLSMCSEGASLAYCSSRNEISVIDVKSGSIFFEMSDHSGRIVDLELSKSGELVATSYSDGTIRVDEINDRVCIFKMRCAWSKLHCLALSFDDCFLAIGSSDGAIRIIDLKRKSIFRKFFGHGSAIKKIEYFDRDEFLISISEDGAMCLWRIDGGVLFHKAFVGDGRLNDFSVDHEGKSIISCHSNGKIKKFVIDKEGQKIIGEWEAFVANPHGVPSHASWRVGRDAESDVLISASGDAWRFLSWDMEDSSEPSGWKRVPLQGYE